MGVVLVSKLDFNDQVDNKIISLMKNLNSTLFRKHLLTIYKSFGNLNLDFADIINDKRLNEFVYELSGCEVEFRCSH